jgi:hypothetical protein
VLMPQRISTKPKRMAAGVGFWVMKLAAGDA